MNRGSRLYRDDRPERVIASMRPRFMNRGSARAIAPVYQADWLQ